MLVTWRPFSLALVHLQELLENSPARDRLRGFLFSSPAHIPEGAESRGELVDVFRYLHPARERAYTCWSTILECRKSNHGTRIDLIAASLSLLPAATSSGVWQHQEGSDHCPVTAEFALRTIPARKPPSLCSAHYSHRQQKLSAFLISQPRLPEPPAARECCPQPRGEWSARPPKRSTSVDSIVLPQAKLKKSSSQPSPVAPPESKGLLPSSLSSPPVTQAETSTWQPALTPGSDGGDSSSQPDSQLSPSEFPEPTPDLPPSSQPPSLDTAWRSVFGAAPKPPRCKGHGEPCKLMTVKKAGPNKDRQFWKCPRPGGSKGDPQANCNFFQWASKQSFKKST